LSDGERGREIERGGREGRVVLGVGDGKDDGDGDGEPSPVNQLRRPPVVATKKENSDRLMMKVFHIGS